MEYSQPIARACLGRRAPRQSVTEHLGTRGAMVDPGTSVERQLPGFAEVGVCDIYVSTPVDLLLISRVGSPCQTCARQLCSEDTPPKDWCYGRGGMYSIPTFLLPCFTPLGRVALYLTPTLTREYAVVAEREGYHVGVYRKYKYINYCIPSNKVVTRPIGSHRLKLQNFKAIAWLPADVSLLLRVPPVVRDRRWLRRYFPGDVWSAITVGLPEMARYQTCRGIRSTATEATQRWERSAMRKPRDTRDMSGRG